MNNSGDRRQRFLDSDQVIIDREIGFLMLTEILPFKETKQKWGLVWEQADSGACICVRSESSDPHTINYLVDHIRHLVINRSEDDAT